MASCKEIHIYTDGACSGNPGPGGWGVVLLYGTHEKEIFGGEADTTNNRMELMAAIQALDAVTEQCDIHLHTDSNYVKDGITKWIHNWKKNGWKNASKKPVKNADLWEQLEISASAHIVKWHWVKGHSGHPRNDQADMLARKGTAMFQG